MTRDSKIVGRYAPSPTGDLHLGNLRTALLAWLHTRLQGGCFILRMEDLDVPRCIAGSADRILKDLEWLGLDWDGEVLYQSARQTHYQAALEQLTDQGLVYPCFCSRKEIRSVISAPHGRTGVYPGTCSALLKPQVQIKTMQKKPALRVRVEDKEVEFVDYCLGQQAQSLQAEVGDFVIKRADGLFAYQLAVVVDDLAQHVSDVVRGADLIDSTARQIYLAGKLEHSCSADHISYWHVPLMLDKNGSRMAKRDGSESVDEWRAKGGGQQELLALLLSSVGLWDSKQGISTTELLRELSFDDLKHKMNN